MCYTERVGHILVLEVSAAVRGEGSWGGVQCGAVCGVSPGSIVCVPCLRGVQPLRMPSISSAVPLLNFSCCCPQVSWRNLDMSTRTLSSCSRRSLSARATLVRSPPTSRLPVPLNVCGVSPRGTLLPNSTAPSPPHSPSGRSDPAVASAPAYHFHCPPLSR